MPRLRQRTGLQVCNLAAKESLLTREVAREQISRYDCLEYRRPKKPAHVHRKLAPLPAKNLDQKVINASVTFDFDAK